MTDRSRSNIDDTSASSQRVRLLERLQLGPVDTITARVELNVLHPAARVQELREAGHLISTHRQTIHDDQGRPHRGCALYFMRTA
jgi:hypothetical protein